MIINRDADFESKLFAALGSQKDMAAKDVREIGICMNALSSLCRATRDDACINLLKEKTDRLEADGVLRNLEKNNLSNMLLGNGLYTLAAFLDDKKYQDMAVGIAGQFKTQPRNDLGYFVDNDEENCLCKAYLSQPFYMNYETKNGGKEHYNDIIDQYKKMHQALFEKTAAGLGTDGHSFTAMAFYAASLIDTMEVMDQMLYEIYRKMQDFYKDAVKAVLHSNVDYNVLSDAGLMFTYAVLKGCRMKALNTEKYEFTVMPLAKEIQADISQIHDAATLSMAALVYSEMIRNREYQDYGRNRGGALWS